MWLWQRHNRLQFSLCGTALDTCCLSSLILCYQHRYKFIGDEHCISAPKSCPTTGVTFWHGTDMQTEHSSFFRISLHTKNSFWLTSPLTIPMPTPRKYPLQLPRTMASLHMCCAELKSRIFLGKNPKSLCEL